MLRRNPAKLDFDLVLFRIPNSRSEFRNYLYDVIIGPIANDILYDVFGIPTSGFLNREQSLQLLLVGPVYTQVVIRTEKAAEQLTWLSSEVLDHEKIMLMQQAMLREQEEYQALFAEKMEKITDLQ